MTAVARRALELGALAACLAACGDNSTSDRACPDAEERLGRRVCVHEVPDTSTWSTITFDAAAVDQGRATTYLVPARDDARLPALVVDAAAFDEPEQSLHYKFLTESFPEFALLDYDEYLELILDAERREWFAGSITEYIAADREPIFGFTVSDPGDDPTATITCAQFREVHAALEARVRVGAVAAVPSSLLQLAVLEECDVPWHDPSTALDYEVYTSARGCGTLRRYTPAELAVATVRAEFGWQDILVTEQAPLDIETIISGIVTGTRQGELSHLNVRSASRGTPNCYARGAYDLLAPYEGKLVELRCTATRALVAEISQEEAQDCWDDLRPDPVEVVSPDLAFSQLVGLLDLPTADPAERLAGVSRFGAKGTNLATLYQRTEPVIQLDGFLIPLHYYDAFVTASGFAATIDELLSDANFLSDGAVRRQDLAALQAEMRVAACDPALVADIEAKILEVFGTDDVMVRFRSSSNAEDSLHFNGAGLYDSTSVCLADDGDADEVGPSRCDPDQSQERGVCRGLTAVWASLWNMRAFEERAWYGIDHRQVAMAILVDTRTAGERANIVAFTGNPLLEGDDRYLVNAQVGELDVVSAVPGVWPEKILLTVEAGAVVDIERLRGSTELPDGEWVLTDADLEELGAYLATFVDLFPIDGDVPPTADVLLDTEWKLRSDDQLVVKQIRPFLR